MKILSTTQIQAWDEFTIKQENTESLALMEKASNTFAIWFMKQFPDKAKTVYVFCGNGNNGGDGFAISRLLIQADYQVNVLLQAKPNKRSKDNETNLEILQNMSQLKLWEIARLEDVPTIEKSSIVIDALFGTGLKGELRGFFKDLVKFLNDLNCKRVSVDIPTGLQGEIHSRGVIFQADCTFSFEQPKLAFLFPENQQYVGKWTAKSIGLSEKYYSQETTTNFLLTKKIAQSLTKKRGKFEHKGNFGHALLLMGSKGKIGAAVLSSYACMRAGSGLTTIYTPSCGYSVLQTSIPEVMVIADEKEDYISCLPETEGYTTIGLGCGIGTNQETQSVVFDLVKSATQALVLDADALNSIAKNKAILSEIPKNFILTPHPKEFERLFGKTANDFERNELQRKKSINLGCYILLKGAHSCISTPEGNCYFNTAGNPGMATA